MAILKSVSMIYVFASVCVCKSECVLTKWLDSIDPGHE